MGYDGFISYSHAADGLLAPRLQDSMHKLARPWYRRRALNVFRDETGLSVDPDLWGSIVAALDGSRYFVLLASPDAAASVWVGREIEHWVAQHGSERILPILTDGEWVWDEARADFDPDRSTAVHPALLGVFRAEPRHIDLRWARSETQLDLRNGAFRDKVAEIAAPLHGISKDELEGEDVRLHRRTRRLAFGVAALLLLLTVASVAAAVMAVRFASSADLAAAEARRNEDRATTNAAEAERQRNAADRNAEEATRQKSAAEVSADEATKQRSVAEANADEATRQKTAADRNAEEATIQKTAADRNAEEATRQKSAAEASADEATKQRSVAEANADEATRQKSAAELSAQEAERQQIVAEANAEEATIQKSAAELSAQAAERERAAAEASAAEAERQRIAAEASAVEANVQRTLAEQNAAIAEEERKATAAANVLLDESNRALTARNAELANANANSESARLAGLARLQLDSDPVLAMRLARQALAVAGDDRRPAVSALFAVMGEQASGIEQVRTLPDSLSLVGSATVTASPDGGTVVVSVLSADLALPRLYVVDLDAPAAPIVTIDVPGGVAHVEVADGGQVLALVARDSGVVATLYDGAGAARYTSAEGATEAFFDGSGLRFVVQVSSRVLVVETATSTVLGDHGGQLVSALDADPFADLRAAEPRRSAALLADGHRLLGFSTALGQWVVWDTADVTAIRSLGSPAPGSLTLAAVDRSGTTVAVSAPSGIRLVDLGSGATEDVGAVAVPGSRLALTDGGAVVLVAAPSGQLDVIVRGFPGIAFSVPGDPCLVRPEPSGRGNWFVLTPVRLDCGRSTAYLSTAFPSYFGPVPGVHLAFDDPPEAIGFPESRAFLVGDGGRLVVHAFDGSGLVAIDRDVTLDRLYAVDPEGRTLVVPSGLPAQLEAWPTDGGAPIRIPGEHEAVRAASGGRLVTFDAAGVLVVWDLDRLARGDEGIDLDGLSGPAWSSEALSPTGARAAVVVPGVDGEVVEVRDTATGALLRSIEVPSDSIVVRLRFLDDDRLVIGVMDAFGGTGVPTANRVVALGTGLATLQPEGLRGMSTNRQWTVSASDGRLVTRDAGNQSVRFSLTVPDPGQVVAITDDALRVAVVEGAEVVVIDQQTASDVRRVPIPGLLVESVAFTPDGSGILVLAQHTGFHRMVSRVDLATGQVTFSVELPSSLDTIRFDFNDPLDLLAISPDGTRVFAAGVVIDAGDGTTLGQPLSGAGRPLASAGGNAAPVLGFAAFSGDTLVLVVDDRAVGFVFDPDRLGEGACGTGGRLTPEQWLVFVGATPYQPAC